MVKQKKNKALIYAIIIFVILLIIDQITKAIITMNNVKMVVIPDILELAMVQNKGGAFGVGEGNTGMFIITNIVVLGLIIRFIYLQKELMDKITIFTLFIILAGGFGNLIDRIARGFVVDFINLFPFINFPRFNFADAYITIGWIFLAFVFARYTYKEMKSSKEIKE